MAMPTGNWTCLAAAGLMLVAGTAWAQRPGSESAEQNVRQSQQYESLVCSNAAFRAKRIQQECGPITDPQLHQSCLASFDCGGGAPKARNWRKAPPSETAR
jgi:hypothetical protein